VWALVSDPYSLSRWWPRTSRVEAVEAEADGSGARWTKVLETTEGRVVRGDYRRLEAVEGERYSWEQEVAGTPFERHLRRSKVEVEVRGAGNDAAEVTLSSDQTLRGLSRLGSPMMRSGQAAILEEALDGLERALTGSGPEAGGHP